MKRKGSHKNKKNTSDDDEEEGSYKEKSNTCIKRVLHEMPSYSSLEDEDDEFSSHDANEPFSMGLNVTDDHFVIDSIRKKKEPYPREDGYPIVGYEEHRNAENQPFGKKYYDDQLDRIKLMNDSDEYTFIKLIAGAMSRSPYDLFDEEDMNRLQQEREEERLKTQLELKRRLVTSDQKERQLKNLYDELERVRRSKSASDKETDEIIEGVFSDIDNLLHDEPIEDLFIDMCSVYDEGNNKPFHQTYYSYTNILSLLTLFDVNISPENMESVVNQAVRKGIHSILKPFKDFSTNQHSDASERYRFVLYCLFNGHITSFEVFQKVILDTIAKFSSSQQTTTNLTSLVDKKLALAITLPCSSLFVSSELEALFKDTQSVAIKGCTLVLGEQKSRALIGFIKGDGTYALSQDSNAPSDLVEYVSSFKVDIGTERRRMFTQSYFIHKWIEKSSWEVIKSEFKQLANDTIQEFANKVFKIATALKKNLFHVFIEERLQEIINQMKKALKGNSSSILENNGLEQFEKHFSNYNFYNDISNSKFKKYLTSDDDKYNYKPELANSAIHRWLDLYVRYIKFLNQSSDEMNSTIHDLERAIDKTRKILTSLNTEEGVIMPSSSRSDKAKPDYKQRKSYTSQPSISGIVKLKEEVVTFINKSYLLVQEYCRELRGLPLEAFHSKSAIQVGLTCDFAVFIARQIANNRIIFEESYKSKHHNNKVLMSCVDAMNDLKKYTYSKRMNQYVITIMETRLNPKKFAYQRDGIKFLADDGIILF